MRKTAVRAVRQQGCTCRPEIGAARWVEGVVPRFEVAHDEHCSLLRSREGPTPDHPSELVLTYDPVVAAMQLALIKGRAA
jgi:hypothetical protein